MSAEITPTERRLIDEAIAAGRVRIIPKGESSFAGAWWDGNRLVSGDEKQSIRHGVNSFYDNRARADRLKEADRKPRKQRGRTMEQLRAEQKARLDEKVAKVRAFAVGKTAEEVCAFMGIQPDSAMHFCRTHNIPVPPRLSTREIDAKRRRDGLQAMDTSNRTILELAEIFGATPQVIYKDMQRYNLPYAPAAPIVQIRAETIQRRASVAELAVKNMSIRRMAIRLGVSQNTVANDLDALGLRQAIHRKVKA